MGRNLVLVATALLLFFAILPVGGWLTERLENRFPANPEIPPDIEGIVVLGGTINQYITAMRGQPSLTAGGERFTEFVYLARRFPDARLIFTGGSGALFDQTLKEADAARVFFDRMGIEQGRVLYESNSRNTLENAELSRKLAGDTIDRQWVLVTSALHMPRAAGVFRKTGWKVIPYPVDFFSDGLRSFRPGFRPLAGMTSLNRGGREWIGLIAYRILGRIDTIFPAPEPVANN
ncbi:MAG: YdcF family protein [Alphaproteobacteria bacterium]